MDSIAHAAILPEPVSPPASGANKNPEKEDSHQNGYSSGRIEPFKFL